VALRGGLLALLVCSLHAQSADPSAHAVAFVGVAPGVVLEVLDWGGDGPLLIFLAGLNNTAHVFDNFATHFTDRFHVVGITRRGFGASSRPDSSYDVSTLVQDIVVVMDRMNFEGAVLIGHSIAGDEMTTLAANHPDRIRALVYLDAAYDRTRAPKLGPEPEQPINAEDTASLESLNARFARVFGWRLPEGEIRAQIVFDTNGRPVRSTQSPTIAAEILKGVH
jgi:non-heme chloroperoxidase